jgi:predicted nucleotide-binding protein (sugar kinase/HSP70/actin superfamily)
VKLGLEAVVSEPCFPVQVAHGHIRWLIEHGPTSSSSRTTSRHRGDRCQAGFFCPWNQTLPFVARAAPFIWEHSDRIICPTLWFNHGTRAVAGEIRQALSESRPRCQAAAGGGCSGTRIRVPRELPCRSEGRREQGGGFVESSNDHAVLLLGRPYNIYDKGINLDIATKMRRYYGVNVIGLDFLELDEAGPVDDIHENMFWSYGRKILAAAAFVRHRPKFHIIYITNFKCGPDSYLKHFITEASGRPFLTLQFDGHNNDAGMLTRCEAYLDSKGVLRRWESTGKTAAGALNR